MAKYFILVKHEGADDSTAWTEELNTMVVTEESPHYKTHEIGMYKIPKRLSAKNVQHYAENLIKWFNAGCRPGEKRRELVKSWTEKEEK